MENENDINNELPDNSTDEQLNEHDLSSDQFFDNWIKSFFE